MRIVKDKTDAGSKKTPMRKIILIGGSDGLGRAFSKVCSGKDIQVINISRTPCPVDEVINIKCDLSVPTEVENAAKAIRQKHPDFDAIVNCAAIVAMEPINKISYSKFEKAWKVNTIAPLYFLSLLFDEIKRNGADILQVGTTADLKDGFENQLAYTATKYGLRGGTYNLGMELKKTASRVIYVHTGGMNTRLHEKDYGLKIEDPSVWMRPEDVAEVLLYLLELPKQMEISEITINRKGRRL
jgi:NAD(P)-dependent dehydrogenase (short-subunit alcohol dehydrogenase family)